jgi:hypothetical protein
VCTQGLTETSLPQNEKEARQIGRRPEDSFPVSAYSGMLSASLHCPALRNLRALCFARDRIDRVGFDTFDFVLGQVAQRCLPHAHTCLWIKLLDSSAIA